MWMMSIVDVNFANFMVDVEASKAVLSRVKAIFDHVKEGIVEMGKLNKEVSVVQKMSNVKKDNPKPFFVYSLDILDDEVDF